MTSQMPRDFFLDAAVDAYDAARCESYGKTVGQEGMSPRNKETIRPMIAAAVDAYQAAEKELARPESLSRLVAARLFDPTYEGRAYFPPKGMTWIEIAAERRRWNISPKHAAIARASDVGGILGWGVPMTYPLVSTVIL